jgi:hypothetical protein
VSAIRYGNLSVELVSRHGARLTRLTVRQDPVDLFRPRHPRALPPSRIVGREQEVAEALRAIGQGRPIEFHAGCGYGRTTLLQQIAASAAERYRGSGCVYLRADGDRAGDVVQQLVTELYDAEQPVKLTPAECTRLLRQAGAIVVLDDAPVDPDQAGYLLDVLPGCSVVLGCTRPVPVRGGSSHQLPGLPADAALTLLAAELGRPLAAQEVRLARNLVTAVDGQPLRLKQAAALLREGSHSIASLAWQAASDPAVLDRLSISALTGPERRALAVLAFTAGVLLPPDVVSVIGQTARLAGCLASLRRKGLAEERRDRFGLPVCQAESYRTMLLGELQLGASAGALCDWLAIRDPSASESQSAASAALAIIESMAQRREWTSVVQLARTTEQILFIAGRWEAWHHVLNHGLTAAKASQAGSAEAFFSHQLGCLQQHRGEPEPARRQPGRPEHHRLHRRLPPGFPAGHGPERARVHSGCRHGQPAEPGADRERHADQRLHGKPVRHRGHPGSPGRHRRCSGRPGHPRHLRRHREHGPSPVSGFEPPACQKPRLLS